MLLDRRSPAFRRMCGLPEYYLRRAELDILASHGDAIAHLVGPACQLIDLGSGVDEPMERMLAALDGPWGFVAIDRDRSAVVDDARRVQARHPSLWVEAVCIDMRQPFDLPPNPGGGRRVAYLPGSAIGNFDPAEALSLMTLWSRQLGRNGLLLVGVDLRKSKLIIEAAYDDVQGVHAALARDVLRRANRELGATFDARMFEHRVDYDPGHGRVRTDLVSLARHDVRIGQKLLRFAEGEALHIEDSWKYSVGDFKALARGAGFRSVRHWIDGRGLFSLHLLEVGAY